MGLHRINCVPLFLLHDLTPTILMCSSFGCKMPNGEAAGLVIPGKSSSADELKGAAFSGAESVMGTLAALIDVLISTLYRGSYLVIFFSFLSHLRRELPAGFGQCGRTGP